MSLAEAEACLGAQQGPEQAGIRIEETRLSGGH
jgi:hypothetical protein